jgi:hypothetical protein
MCESRLTSRWFRRASNVAKKLFVAVGSAVLAVSASAASEPDFSAKIPDTLKGPFISDVPTIVALDCGSEPGKCDGPLNFTKLIKAKAVGNTENFENPFKLEILTDMLDLIGDDIEERRKLAGLVEKDNQHLNIAFLNNLESRVELVGIVNRMDRQFINDAGSNLTKDQRKCGEISLIYRFSYSIKNGTQKSRLPITMNIVFPALPGDTKGGSITCQEVAKRWVSLMDIKEQDTQARVSSFTDPATGPLSLIDGKDIDRLELNMQIYRKPGSSAIDFGTKAEYLIRVFQWVPGDKTEKEGTKEKGGYFGPKHLTNQIDRQSMLCEEGDSAKTCKAKEARRKELVDFLQKSATVADIDRGTLNIEEKFLARRAISISPGGVHRSGNQPFWNSRGSGKIAKSQQIISDSEIRQAIANFEKNPKNQFSFIKSPEDFRTRLNDSTCTGCHQTRAIAGFHFPGADRDGTAIVNSVLLPGSPFFYGDQPRRAEIVREIARQADGELILEKLAIGYTARPLFKLASYFKDTQLLDGWGASCILPEYLNETRRTSWTCRAGLECGQAFVSDNEPWVGTCLPSAEKRQIGDALQAGKISTSAFGRDSYRRTYPRIDDTDNERNHLIPKNALPSNPPKDNSYYGAHQEFYFGPEKPLTKEEVRDDDTGGFPGGMLRLSECRGLSNEATCGMIASTGFNPCIGRIGVDPQITLGRCFENFTSFSGMRACDAASPCRDDYICVKPMLSPGKSPDDTSFKRMDALFAARNARLTTEPYFELVNNKKYVASDYYGQLRPDDDWIKRDDRRGICIPPYFVFQFRSDKHPSP